MSILFCAIAGTLVLIVLIIIRKRNGQKILPALIDLGISIVLCFLLTAWFVVPFYDFYLTESMKVKTESVALAYRHAIEPFRIFVGFWPFTAMAGSTAIGSGTTGEMPLGLGSALVGIFALAVYYLVVKNFAIHLIEKQ